MQGRYHNADIVVEIGTGEKGGEETGEDGNRMSRARKKEEVREQGQKKR